MVEYLIVVSRDSSEHMQRNVSKFVSLMEKVRKDLRMETRRQSYFRVPNIWKAILLQNKKKEEGSLVVSLSSNEVEGEEALCKITSKRQTVTEKLGFRQALTMGEKEDRVLFLP